MQQQLEELRTFAVALAQHAAVPIVNHYKQARVDLKADGSEVTQADREAETCVRKMIAEHYPDHAVHGEEFDDQGPSDAEYQWIIDPLDGTRWFALGVPLFGTLIGLMHQGEPVVGVIHMPISRELVFASRGGGCWAQLRDNEPTRVSVVADPIAELDQAMISASGTHASDIEPVDGRPTAMLSRLIQRAGTFRFCGDCLQHALVAQGTLHAAIDTIMAPWDIAAIVPCVEEAGGVVSNLRGERDNIVYGGSLVTACNSQVQEAVLATLATS